jgi:hypothetical protein
MENFEYILRYYLPVKPYFDEEYTAKRFEELISFCKDTGCETVMFFVALNPDWYYMPDTIENCRAVREQLLPYVKKLREEGIAYQINFQDWIGQTLGGADFSDVFSWENMVDHKGRESLGTGCFFGEKFLKISEERLRIWAETEPDAIWLDDDFRLHNHGSPSLAAAEGKPRYADYYCFCDEHIRRFNEKHGTSYDRETILSEIQKDGEPTEMRVKYLDFQAETIAEAADWVRNAVQSISPKTHLAQMTSLPDVHAAEGRNWGTFLTSLCGEYDPIIRAHFGEYAEPSSRDFVTPFRMLSQLRANIRECFDGHVEYYTEIENTRYTVWTKSRAASVYQLFLSAFMGTPGVTLAIHDLDGGALGEEPRYWAMLKDNKELLNTVKTYGFDKMKELGVAIPTSSDSGRKIRLSGGGYEEMGGNGRYFEHYLLKMGIPCTYVNGKELDSGKVIALDRFTASYLSDDELKLILSGGVLMEGGAAEVLIGRGYAEYIGVDSMTLKRCDANVEIIKTFTRPDGTHIRIPSRAPIGCWYESELNETTQVLSEFADPRGNRSAAMTRFENSLGGKVAVYHAVKDFGNGFYTHNRETFIKDVIASLSPEIPRIDCDSYLLTTVRENENGDRYYFVCNLSTDAIDKLTIDGERVDITLGVYGCAIFERKNGTLNLVVKARI